MWTREGRRQTTAHTVRQVRVVDLPASKSLKFGMRGFIRYKCCPSLAERENRAAAAPSEIELPELLRLVLKSQVHWLELIGAQAKKCVVILVEKVIDCGC